MRLERRGSYGALSALLGAISITGLGACAGAVHGAGHAGLSGGGGQASGQQVWEGRHRRTTLARHDACHG